MSPRGLPSTILTPTLRFGRRTENALPTTLEWSRDGSPARECQWLRQSGVADEKSPARDSRRLVVGWQSADFHHTGTWRETVGVDAADRRRSEASARCAGRVQPWTARARPTDAGLRTYPTNRDEMKFMRAFPPRTRGGSCLPKAARSRRGEGMAGRFILFLRTEF